MNSRTLAFALLLAAALPAQQTFGTPCVGGTGSLPSISYPTSSWISNPSTLEQIALLDATPGASSSLLIGADPASRINVDLTLIGADGCSLYVAPFISVPQLVQPDGSVLVSLLGPSFGPQFLFQWVLLDPNAPRQFKITSTAAVSATVPMRGTGFRITDLDIRDPHIFVPVAPFICPDLTDNGFLTFLSINQSIQDALSMDSDGDLQLDVGAVLLLREDPTGTGGVVDFVPAGCTAPAATTSCTIPGMIPDARPTYTNAPSSCLAPRPGTTRGYSPPITTPSGPCFSTTSTSFSFDLLGISVPLEGVQIGATYVGSPPTALTNGLIMGFLPEATANALLIPASTPLVGGLPISSLLPGGPGACGPGNDKDVGPDGTTPGWWFYFNFQAQEVPVSP